ncbi:hypothetical protein VTL71DRAFT_8814 [Oculimacula yallundae]|uniref:Piwi domain-containing protein n=1 Tax=Oculimacula yallundae TaxID=86028 RepID=A0ABR4D130_9HELO
MAAQRCSKCKTDDHKLFDCEKTWPFHDKQECDRCGGNHDTGLAKVCKQRENIINCATCGHEGHHNKTQCKIGDGLKDDHLRQWTKSKFEAFIKKNPRRVNTFAQDPNQIVVAIIGGPPAIDPTEQLETELQITPFNYTAPVSTNVQIERLAWAREVYDSVPYTGNRDPPRRIEVETNFFKVNFVSKTLFHKYRIELGLLNGRTVKKEEVKKALIFKLLTVQRPPAATTKWVSDFATYIISTAPLYPEFGTHKSTNASTPTSFMVPHRLSPIPGKEPAKMETLIHYQGTFDKDLLTKFVKNMGNRQVPTDLANYNLDDDVRILNMVSWKNINDPLVFGGGIVGKKFYPDPFRSNTALYSGGGLTGTTPVYVLSRGFFSSIRPGIGDTAERGLFLNVNPTTSAFFPDVNLMAWLKVRGGMEINGNPARETREEIIGRRVTFKGDKLDSKGKRKRRVIMGFEGRVGEKTFPDKVTLKKTNMWEYMQRTYGTGPNRLTFDKNACCVQVGNRDNSKLYPADQLEIVPYQPVKNILNNDYTKEMLDAAQKSPDDNKRAIFGKALGPLGVTRPTDGSASKDSAGLLVVSPGMDSAFYKGFGLNISNELVKVKARMLPAPTLLFKGNKPDKVQDSLGLGYKGTWNLSDITFYSPGRPSDETEYLELGFIKMGNVSDTDIDTFANQLHLDLNKYGITPNHNKKDNKVDYRIVNGGPLDVDRTSMAKNLLAACLGKNGGPGLRGGPNFLIFVMQEKSIPAYANIKWWADCRNNLPSICLTKAVMNKKKKKTSFVDSNMVGNLCLKINFKLAGTTHAIKGSEAWGGAHKRTMIVGADVSHPGQSSACPSMAGVVATVGSDVFHYLASARLQEGGQEHIESLDSMIEERLEAYLKWDEEVPDHILFYRDGVSESQFGMIKQKELPLIRAGCIRWGKKQGKDNWTPKITLLVVGKRHHTRFFPPVAGSTAKDKNFQSGLVVDTVITSPYKCDFYLQSHDCALGTARTAHYIVITNESDYKMDQLQEVTCKLCFLSARATKALSVCTPARYADILCDRLRCYMKPHLKRQDADNPTTIDHCRTDPDSWAINRANHPDRENPWRPAYDDIMFYL